MMISSNTSNGKCCRRPYRRRVSSFFYTHLDSTVMLEYPIDHSLFTITSMSDSKCSPQFEYSGRCA